LSRTFLLGDKFIEFLIDTWLIVMKIYPHSSKYFGFLYTKWEGAGIFYIRG